MEKQISRWSYFLGVAGVVVAIGWRLLAPFQPRAEGFDLDCPHPHLPHCDGGCLGDAHDNNSPTGRHLFSKKSVNGRGTSLH